MVEEKIGEKIFIGSTAYDLLDLRPELADTLENWGCKPIYHENPNFPRKPGLHSHDVCLEAVKECNTYLLIINRRLGGIYAGNKYPQKDISITQYETEVALKEGKKIYVFVRNSVWDEEATYKHNLAQKPPILIVPKHVDSPKVFEFIDFINHQVNDNWIDRFTDVVELKQKLYVLLNVPLGDDQLPQKYAVTCRDEFERKFTFPSLEKQKSYELLKCLYDCGCYLQGHFELVSKKHSSRFIRLWRVLNSEDGCVRILAPLIEQIVNAKIQFTGFVAPSTKTGYRLALELGKRLDKEVRLVRTDNQKRNYTVHKEDFEKKDDSWLYVDDLTTTGSGLGLGIKALVDEKVNVIGAAVCLIRDSQAFENLKKKLKKDFNIYPSLVFNVGYVSLEEETKEPSECPGCINLKSERIN